MKKYFLTGLVILLPLILTLVLIIFLFDLFTEPFVSIVDPLVQYIQIKLHFNLPHDFTLFLSRLLSLIFLLAFILILGFITQLFLVKTLIQWGNQLMYRIPFIRTVYRVSKEIFTALFSMDEKKAFKKPVMVPFPNKSNYAAAFLAGEVAPECQRKIETPLASVFLPTAPHPISGFFFLVPQTDVKEIKMTNEEVLKFIISCGTILPESKSKEIDEF